MENGGGSWSTKRLLPSKVNSFAQIVLQIDTEETVEIIY
jgi:hypothetical protein